MKVYSVFLEFLRTKNLKMTKQREIILTVLIKSRKHLSVDELYSEVEKIDASIGHATVFRTAKLLVEANIASTIDFGDKITRFEVTYGHSHHDHLICVNCGKYIESEENELGELENLLKQRYNFTMLRDKIQILGLCKDCI